MGLLFTGLAVVAWGDAEPAAVRGSAFTSVDAVTPSYLGATSAEAPDDVPTDDEPDEDPHTRRIANVGEVDLRVPSRDELVVGFHEGSLPGTLRLDPVDDGVEMRTMPTRHRPTPSRSAVDVAVEPGSTVLSPVSGEVSRVEPYTLYGSYPDTKVEIEPAADRSKKVTVLHVSEVDVEPGDEVVGGQSEIAGSATQFPFSSQIDEWAGPVPHAHVEVTEE